MNPPPVEQLPSSDGADDAFVQLLAAWDERLASGKSTQLPEATPAVAGLRERLEKAQSCVKLLNQLWPKPPPPLAADVGPRAYARFGRYEIIRELGRGGHGIVFLAADGVLKRQLALKVPRPAVLSDDGLRMRFLREAEATARLDHPHILHVYEVGSEGPICFTAAAYCDGGTLQDWLARASAPCEPREAAEIISVLADAIHHAHTRGVLHRDLKPSNVLLTRRHESNAECGVRSAECGVAHAPHSALRTPHSALLDGWVLKIADFGLAKVLDSQQDSTLHGVVMGTANYMAPEQAAGNNADVGVTADVYSLGVMLYELLTGAPPLVAPSQLAKLNRAAGDEAAWPSGIRRRISPDLRTICMTCLKTDPAQRYQSAAALAADLSRFLRGETVTTRPLTLPERILRTLWRHPAISLLSVAAVSLAIGLVAQLYLHNRELTAKNKELASHARSLNELNQFALKESEENRRRSLGAKLRVVQQFASAGNLRQLTEVLHETFPQNPAEEDLREFAWRYWWNRCRNGEVFHLPGHVKHVNAAAFSPDGKWIATGSDDETVRVWDYATGRETARLYDMGVEVLEVAISPGGTYVAGGGGDGQIRVWSTTNWRVVATLEANDKPNRAPNVPKVLIEGLVFSDDSTLISGGTDGWLRVWNVKSGQQVDEYGLAHQRYVNSLAIAPRHKLLLVGMHKGEIQLRSLSDVGNLVGAMHQKHEENVHSMAVSLQEDRVFSCDLRGDLRLWDLDQRTSQNLFDDGPPYGNSPTAISPCGRWLAAAAAGGIVRIIDAKTGGILKERQLGMGVGALEFSRAGDALLVAGQEGQVVLWQPHAVRPEQPAGHEDEVWSLAFHPEGDTFVTASDDDTVREWNTASGELLREVLVQNGAVADAAYSPDGALLATTSLEETEPRVHLWKMPGGSLHKSLHGHAGKVYSIAFHPLQKDVLVTGAKEVIVWDAAAGKITRILEDSRQSNKKVKSVAFSGDGSLLAFASEDGQAYLYRYPELKRVAALECGGEVWTVAFSPDGESLAAGNRNGSVTVWDLRALERRFVLKGHLLGVLSVAYSHDGRTIATGSEDKTIRLWGPSTGQELCTLTDHGEKVMRLKFSPDDQWLASCSFDGGVRLWHAPKTSLPAISAAAQEKRP